MFYYVSDARGRFVVGHDETMPLIAPGKQATGAALRLVREVTLAVGPLFSTHVALTVAGRIGVSEAAAYKALSLAARAGIVTRLKGGLYRAAPPFGPPRVPEFLIATKLVQPSAISGQSALSYWGLIDQIPLHIVTASTSRAVLPPMSRGGARIESSRSGRHGWVIEGITYLYRKIPEAELFGIVDVWLDTETQVPMFDRERTVLDTFLHPRAEGMGQLGEALIEQHLQDLDLDQLQRYAEAAGKAHVRARVAQSVHHATTQVTDANDL
jgi:predicted transcriptional regulator of viral defense system